MKVLSPGEHENDQARVVSSAYTKEWNPPGIEAECQWCARFSPQDSLAGASTEPEIVASRWTESTRSRLFRPGCPPWRSAREVRQWT